MNNGFKIDRAGTVSALKSPVGRTVWIGSVRRMGSGWAASNTADVTTHGYRSQQAAAESLYSAYLQSVNQEV